MKKILWKSASVIGIAVVLLAAEASHTGSDLVYTVPTAVVGCLVCFAGVIHVRQIGTKARTIHTASTAYRLGFRRSKRDMEGERQHEV